MKSYKVCCEATQDNDTFFCESAQDAADKYLAGYQTVDVDGVPVAEGERYSTLNVLSGEDEFCELSVPVIADGVGGVQRGMVQ